MSAGKKIIPSLAILFTCLKTAANVDPVRVFHVYIDSLPEVQAETDTLGGQYYRLNGTYIKSYWHSFRKAATSPARWDGSDWRNFGIITAAGGLLVLSDLEIRNFFQRNQSPLATSVSDHIEPLANRYSPLILTSFYLTGVILKDRKLEHAALITTKSFAISTLFYVLTKATIRRQRPFRATDQYEFSPPFSKDKLTSFPSGHTNTVFSIATAMAIEYKHKKWVPVLCYSLAGLTGLSRIYHNRHWASDVLFGAAIGHFVTKAIYAKEKKKKLTVVE